MNASIRSTNLTIALLLALPFATAQAASLTYHGNLQDGGKPANGNYDIQLTLYSAASGGKAIGAPITLYGVAVHGGTFSTDVDFGAAANDGGSYWVGVAVAPQGSGDFTALDSRTPASVTAVETCNGTWALDGNTGNPNGSFLGNVDNQPLVFKVNGVQLGTLASSNNSSSPDAPNVVFGSSSNFAGPNAGGATVAGGGRPVSYCGYNGQQSCANAAFGTYSTVGGGRGNQAWGYAATVAGGEDNIAYGNNTFAGGEGAFALGAGSFVWTDSSVDDQTFGSVAPFSNDNSFDVRATGGFYFVTGVNGSGQYVGVKLDAGGGGWSNLSDRNMKTAITRIDTDRILDNVLAMPVTTWQYVTQKSDIRHMGPMAQDFYAAFRLGEDERHINDIDEGGVALAAIQGLNQKLEREYKKIADEDAALRAQNAALVAKLDRLDSRMATIEVAQHEAHAVKFRVALQGE